MPTRLDRITDWDAEAKTVHYHPDELALRFTISQRHLRRLFRRWLDVTPGKWLALVKLREVPRHYAQGEPLKVIATHLGYSHYEAFSRAFKKAYGVSPRAFLAAHTSTQPGKPMSENGKFKNLIPEKKAHTTAKSES